MEQNLGDVPSTDDRARKDMAIACRLGVPPVMARKCCTLLLLARPLWANVEGGCLPLNNEHHTESDNAIQ